jgi:hypothetical protein
MYELIVFKLIDRHFKLLQHANKVKLLRHANKVRQAPTTSLHTTFVI